MEMLKKYVFTTVLEDMESYMEIDDDEAQSVYDNVFDKCYMIDDLEWESVVLNVDSDDVKNPDINGNEVNDNTIYFLTDSNEFIPIDDKSTKYKEFMNKYNINQNQDFHN